ncbi:Uncharacterised protein [Acinetobacter baumannii]|nr:Uncharacterised protein [Acinetobacter baumannii]
MWLETNRVTCSARSVSSVGISLPKSDRRCAVSSVFKWVCKIGNPCLIALWQNSKSLGAGASRSVNTKPASGIPLLVARLLASNTSVRSEALMISSPAMNLFSSYSMLEAIKLECKIRRVFASP